MDYRTITFEDIKRIHDYLESIKPIGKTNVTVSMVDWDVAENRIREYFKVRGFQVSDKGIETILCTLAFLADAKAIHLSDVVDQAFQEPKIFASTFDMGMRVNFPPGGIPIMDQA
jgi:hypothetical protein